MSGLTRLVLKILVRFFAVRGKRHQARIDKIIQDSHDNGIGV